MLDEQKLRGRLPIGWIGDDFFYHQTIGSTNTEAVLLAEAGAPHGTLVLADSQTSGKGREGRQWITLPGTALAFSLILRPTNLDVDHWLRLFGLGAISVAEALSGLGLQPEIKWPNDVLLVGKKVAGILVNSAWIGEMVDYSVLGIGLNVTAEAIPDDTELDFPALAVEEALGKSIDREELLTAILSNLEEQFERIDALTLVRDWEKRLAYLDEEVVIEKSGGAIVGKLLGLTSKGELKILKTPGQEEIVSYGELQLRPL